MGQDVQNLAVRFAHKEATDAPRLVSQRVDHLAAHLFRCRLGAVDVVHLNGHVGVHRCARVSLHHIDLGRRVVSGREGTDPTLVHDGLETEDVLVELSARGRIGALEVRDDASNLHAHSMPLSRLLRCEASRPQRATVERPLAASLHSQLYRREDSHEALIRAA